MSDAGPNQQEINTDISQFLNTKQTFNHSMTGVTHRDGDKPEAILDSESNDGGPFYSKKVTITKESRISNQQGKNRLNADFSPRIRTHAAPPQMPFNLLHGPSAVMFNHNHNISNVSETMISRHTYSKPRNTLNQAAAMMINN